MNVMPPIHLLMPKKRQSINKQRYHKKQEQKQKQKAKPEPHPVIAF